MPYFNYAQREIECKIVYYGPGLGGKTTNLKHIYQHTNPDAKGKLISLATDTDRTLYFDFLPLSLGEVRGFKIKFRLYTVPGQVFYSATRKLVLKAVDGVVFVADSQIARADANLESLDDLEANLGELGLSLGTMAHVMQYNKRDMPGIESVETLRGMLNRYNAPDYEAIAQSGEGVFDTLKAVGKLVLTKLKESSGR